ncbi:MAG TPA: hypothetical protein ENI88_13425 [Desulfobulbus sp.]|nr:hypothetical protein [Desulfobulbus sp.]
MRQNCFLSVLLCALFIFIVSGCARSTPSGKWLKSRDGGLSFENRAILPDHTYYFIGNEVTPEAIIAVDNRYRLKTRVWSRVDITQKMLNDWMFWIDTRLSPACPHYGGVILTPDGDKAGVWYSRKWKSVVKVPEPGVLQVYKPYSLSGSLCARQERSNDL